MKSKEMKKRLLMTLVILYLAIPVIAAPENSKLISYFQAKSIPVFHLEDQQGTVVVRVRYANVDDLNVAKLESDQLTVLQKIVDEYPRSRVITLEYFAGDVKILESDYRTSDAVDFTKGTKDREGLLADASLNIVGGRDALLSSDPPREWNVEEEEKSTETGTNLGDLKSHSLPPEQERFEMARQSLIAKEYDRAIGQFRTTIDALPLQSFQGLGLCYYYKKSYYDAFYYFAKAYRENPRSPMTLFYMAATLDHWGRGPEAVFCFETYLRLNDSDNKRRDIAHQRLEYIKSQMRRRKYFLYRTVDEVIYVILGDKINS
jgi:tetratricopeptide (TPR) repeat protein